MSVRKVSEMLDLPMFFIFSKASENQAFLTLFSFPGEFSLGGAERLRKSKIPYVYITFVNMSVRKVSEMLDLPMFFRVSKTSENQAFLRLFSLPGESSLGGAERLRNPKYLTYTLLS